MKILTHDIEVTAYEGEGVGVECSCGWSWRSGTMTETLAGVVEAARKHVGGWSR